ncbi:hypothetical protein [Sessilibacter corallicola]|uniref:Uncharacterized protein n=1 Tax=Sessilibacter corallicola TaxID=2904075 RepID=A0ABQ0A4W0_9GAMM
MEWSLNLLNQTTYDLDNKDYQLPSPIKIHSATILSALYFPEFQDMLLEVHKTQFDMLETANNFLQAKRDGSNIVWLHSKEKSITIKDPHEMARKFDKEFFPIMQKESLLLDTLTENIKSNAYRYRYNYRERNVLQ